MWMKYANTHRNDCLGPTPTSNRANVSFFSHTLAVSDANSCTVRPMILICISIYVYTIIRAMSTVISAMSTQYSAAVCLFAHFLPLYLSLVCELAPSSLEKNVSTHNLTTTVSLDLVCLLACVCIIFELSVHLLCVCDVWWMRRCDVWSGYVCRWMRSYTVSVLAYVSGVTLLGVVWANDRGCSQPE